jgi:hypothetical protein
MATIEAGCSERGEQNSATRCPSWIGSPGNGLDVESHPIDNNGCAKGETTLGVTMGVVAIEHHGQGDRGLMTAGQVRLAMVASCQASFNIAGAVSGFYHTWMKNRCGLPGLLPGPSGPS